MHHTEDRDDPEFAAAFAELYPEVRRIAHIALQRGHVPWQGDRTLDTTALAHETFLKLRRANALRWRDRDHFFALVARTMRFVLVDYARSRTRSRRGGDVQHVPLEDVAIMSPALAEEVLALDQALHALARRDSRLARVVECRYILGLSLDETAAALGVSTMTVKRDWLSARALLNEALSPSPSQATDTDSSPLGPPRSI